MTDPRGTRAGREWSKKVVARDGQCVWCGHTGSEDNPLQGDHIKPYSKYPHLALDLTNGQCLCRNCNLKKSDKTEVEMKRRDWYDRHWLSSIA